MQNVQLQPAEALKANCCGVSYVFILNCSIHDVNLTHHFLACFQIWYKHGSLAPVAEDAIHGIIASPFTPAKNDVKPAVTSKTFYLNATITSALWPEKSKHALQRDLNNRTTRRHRSERFASWSPRENRYTTSHHSCSPGDSTTALEGLFAVLESGP